VIPYIEIPPLRLGDWVVAQPFGLLVAIGCVVGWFVTLREARLRGLDQKVAEGAAMWAILLGFPIGTLFDLVFYYPEVLLNDPAAVLRIWGYMSSYGGFIGGAIGVIGYLVLRRQPVLAYCDCIIVGLAFGWFFGRLGCTIVHDHPGAPTTFPLGVRYPDTVRHDLGFYEWLFTIGLLILLHVIPRHRLAPGMTLGIVCIVYAPVRFGFDFLRVEDRLYLGFTPAQFASLALLATGLWLVLRQRRAATA
jgi:phosphatidylglycerol:prolipoprotein diacylglycerol transferase